ncbi:MAG: sulfotransferase family protein [Oceanicaulis sp.]
MSVVPTAVIVGFPKCGTSSLFDWLASHPDIGGSTPKETYFFVDPGTHMYNSKAHAANGLSGYREFFTAEAAARPVRLEATPSYVYSRTALELLPDLNPDMRFIFLVREPARQIYSLYQYFKNNWDWIATDMSFKTFLEHSRNGSHAFKGNELAVHALENARYVDHLDRWRARVGRERMTILVMEEFMRDPVTGLHGLCTTLGVDPSFFDDFDFRSSNETYQVRRAWLQRFNIGVRSRLPKGLFYRGLRSVYRKLNTARPAGPDAAEADAVATLRQAYGAHNDALAERYGLDLSSWMKAPGLPS